MKKATILPEELLPSTGSNWEYRLRDCVRSYNSSITFIFTKTANYDSCSGSTIFILHPPSVADAFLCSTYYYAIKYLYQLQYFSSGAEDYYFTGIYYYLRITRCYSINFTAERVHKVAGNGDFERT